MPRYHDGDLFCDVCGEPWDAQGVRKFSDMSEAEALKFLQGKGCPCCPEDPEEAKAKKEAIFKSEGFDETEFF